MVFGKSVELQVRREDLLKNDKCANGTNRRTILWQLQE